jgi:hypothetical protein
MRCFTRSLRDLLCTEKLALVFEQERSLAELREASLASLPFPPFDSLHVAEALLIVIGSV